jgi:hypothetical protein
MPQSRPILGLLCAFVLAVLPGRAQEPAESKAPPKIDGTWVMLIEGHQVGLEVEDKSGTLEGTLHIMGQRVLVDGTLKDGAFTLTSDDNVGDTQSHGATVKMRIVGTHKADDTLEGTIDLPRGPMAWTAERLKKP